MQVKDSMYHKCWKLEGNKITIGDSRKKQEGGYENCNWFGLLAGKAKEAGIQEGDIFTINSGRVFSVKKGDKFYTDVTIFDAEVTNKAKETTNTTIHDDLPF